MLFLGAWFLSLQLWLSLSWLHHCVVPSSSFCGLEHSITADCFFTCTRLLIFTQQEWMETHINSHFLLSIFWIHLDGNLTYVTVIQVIDHFTDFTQGPAPSSWGVLHSLWRQSYIVFCGSGGSFSEKTTLAMSSEYKVSTSHFSSWLSTTLKRVEQQQFGGSWVSDSLLNNDKGY